MTEAYSHDKTDDLTPSQRRAVEHAAGPLLVLAGPGSGKTRVITRRIARLVETGVDPVRILAITFTNKAAGEMAERVERLLPGARVWVSTFHRFCARLLRRRADAVGLKPNFTILDTDDQRRIIRELVKQINYDVVHFPPDRLAERISRLKNDLLSPAEFRQVRDERIGDLWDSVIARVYPEYQARLLESNSVDFDDLLLHVVHMLQENPEIRHELDERFQYVLVDEYQDTNPAQYQLVAGLSRDYPNLCVTGDPDQSIYGWRGARIENILRFEADYPQAAVIRLEENFRSTKSILRAADRLIAWNVRRKAKTMRTDNPEGRDVELLRFESAQAEAAGIARDIRAGVESGSFRWSDTAIFYRVNALSREFEHALSQQRIPYQVASGFAFYERAEVKDLLSYLRLIANPQDRAAFLRVVNVPARAIGKTSLKRLVAWADSRRLPLLEAARRAAECRDLPRRGAPAFVAFAKLIDEHRSGSIGTVRRLLESVLARTAYADPWRESESEQDRQRAANVDELVTAAAHYDAGAGENASLEGFLETTALVADVDNVDGAADCVTLMTLHSAKGLEFPVVYIVGVEQGFLPHQRAVDGHDDREYEEERRLLFVGMTRARARLYLSRTVIRDLRGRAVSSVPSPFLREIAPVESEPVESELAESKPDAQAEQFVGSIARNRVAADDVKRPTLMTGADLLAGMNARGANVPSGFAIGMSVRHPRYGVGHVVKIRGFARNGLITVEFDDGRSETFVAGKNPLQPVGAG